MDYENFTALVKSLDDMFGAVVDVDTIKYVLAQCNGDVGKSIVELIKISELADGDNENKMNDEVSPQVDSSYSVIANKPVTRTYFSIDSNYGVISKAPQPTLNRRNFSFSSLNHSSETTLYDIERIVDYINDGSRLLVLMRGLPGSGKSYLAKQIADKTVEGHYATYICSTDDYFLNGNRYVFNASDLSSAHAWNQKRVHNMLCQGVSPIIVDNTNLEMWEMKPYAAFAVDYGYEIEIVEPFTSWAKNARELARKNVHNVSSDKIKRMMEKYESNVTVERLKKTYNLNYQADFAPPQPRNIPKFSRRKCIDNNIEGSSPTVNDQAIQLNNKHEATKCIRDKNADLSELMMNLQCNNLEKNPPTNAILKLDDSPAIDKLENEDTSVLENSHTASEPFVQWSDGEPWNDQSKALKTPESNVDNTPKPQRPIKENTNKSKNNDVTLLQHFQPFTDWTTIENQWSSFDLGNTSWRAIENVLPENQTKDSSTNTHSNEIVSFSDKILTGQCREINKDFICPVSMKNPPLILKLDKSSMTNEEVEITESGDKNFETFRRMFMQVTETDLKEIYEKCGGDVNWAVEILLDGDSDGNDVLENYRSHQNIEPKLDLTYNNKADSSSIDMKEPNSPPHENTAIASSNIVNSPVENQASKFKRKDKVLSETSLELKRQLEKNFTIPDSFYSEHCLKIKKIRRGESLVNPSGTKSDNEILEKNTSNLSQDNVNEETDSIEEMLTMYLGTKFIRQIDQIFGMDVDYPDTILPVISMPKSLLNQIHALWIESLSHQVDVQHQLSEMLLKEDNDFARKLTEKEKEQAERGLPQKPPNLQEIMDMELAFALANAESKNLNDKGHEDLATKLSKQKLTELFPNMDKETLYEILEAHNNKFEQTVQVLLMSTGMSDGSEDENAVSRLICQHDWEKKQAKLLEKTQQEMSKLTVDDDMEDVDISQVTTHREEARQHLNVRNRYLSQAQDYFQKGMLQVASYYSQIAALHKKKFDFANLRAANSLIQMHSAGSDSATLDLHYLYVAEALEALDMFLDKNISELAAAVGSGPHAIRQRSLFLITGRGVHSRGGPRIKPAVKKRLKQRSISFAQVNPGLLSVTVDNSDKMTHQL